MNRTSSGSMGLEKAIQGFIQSKQAEGCRDNTIITYTQQLGVWREYAGDIGVGAVTPQDVRAFLAWMRTGYESLRINGPQKPISPKTIHNYWITLSALFTWAKDEFDLPSPMKSVPAPSFEDSPVEPFTQDEVKRLLKACDYSAEAQTSERRKFIMRRPTGTRDRAMLLTLLDTGLRASELCSLLVGDVDMKTGKVEVKHGTQGGTKGGKGRVVYLAKAARRQLWRYPSQREDGEDPRTPLFLGKLHRRMNKGVLRQVIARLGEKAGVAHAHPHRFRHTFALTYLRSAGDVFTLQALLGHSALEMVQHYARIAQIDIEQAHRRASPVDNWRL
ncbi:MAG: tyrosine-type recombinase/integrase [Anaerolineales bacterium]